jgi:ribosomal protein L17
MNSENNQIASGSVLTMAEKSKLKTPEERAKYIEQLADPIIADAARREAERRRHNDNEMEKLKNWLKEKGAQ